MRASLILFLTCALLQAVCGEVNSALTPLHVNLFVAGLCVPLAALSLPYWGGLGACAMAGALLDAYSPLAFGVQMLGLMAAHAVVFALRHRTPHQEGTTRLLVALATNLALFILLTAATVGRSPVMPEAWPRLAADLVLSQAAVGLAGPWFFALQKRSLALVLVETARSS